MSCTLFPCWAKYWVDSALAADVGVDAAGFGHSQVDRIPLDLREDVREAVPLLRLPAHQAQDVLLDGRDQVRQVQLRAHDIVTHALEQVLHVRGSKFDTIPITTRADWNTGI